MPVSNADLAPTLLTLAGVPVPGSMTGRVIDEALKTGPDPERVSVQPRVETAQTADGSYQVDAHITLVGRERYLDYTQVRRK